MILKMEMTISKKKTKTIKVKIINLKKVREIKKTTKIKPMDNLMISINKMRMINLTSNNNSQKMKKKMTTSPSMLMNRTNS